MINELEKTREGAEAPPVSLKSEYLPHLLRKKVPFTIMNHFAPCCLLSMVPISFLAHTFFLHDPTWSDDVFNIIILAFITGAISSMASILFLAFKDRRHRKHHYIFAHDATVNDYMTRALTSFCIGFATSCLVVSEGGTLLLTGIVLAVAYIQVKVFTRIIVPLLSPGQHADWHLAGQIVQLYLTIITTFTLLNASMDIVHRFTSHDVLPFGFGKGFDLVINAFYFSIVTITTLGYGDIIPSTLDAKLIVSLECLAGYFMFALMVGIITKGIVDKKNAPE